MIIEKERVFVFGASGHAKVVLDIIERQGGYSVGCVLDDNLALSGKKLHGHTILSPRERILSAGIKRGIVAVGDNVARCRISEWLRKKGFSLVSLIHPSVQLARGVTIGDGTVLMPGVVINSDAKIGRDAIINTCSSVDHDCVIGSGVHVAPGSVLCGAVRVGNMAFIGAGTVIIPNISVGSRATVGAGSTVISNIPPGVTVMGSPARAKI